MKILSTYSGKISGTDYAPVFEETVHVYRDSVDFFINVLLKEWDALSAISTKFEQVPFVESLTHSTKVHPVPKYDFDRAFPMMPSYLRRSAISEAIGKVFSYKSNLANWNASPKGKKPSSPRAGYVYPSLYKGNMFLMGGQYTVKIKVYIHNAWDWITVHIRKSNMDYISRRCASRTMKAPSLRKRGRNWFLDFVFEEKRTLDEKPVIDTTIVAVDLGINNACTCSVMRADGTILGREFLKLTREQGRLTHALGVIKNAQHHGSRHMPKLWASAKGINDDIAVKTAQFIVDTAVLYNADVIVMEHLDLQGKRKGSKKQRLHMWKAQYVQAMVTDKAHRLCMRISRVCAWQTSRLAYDGSGRVKRGKEAELGSYSVCMFQTGKIYNCDLNASYNIGSRYFVRELLKALPEKARSDIRAKVPGYQKRSTCTLSTLVSLYAVLAA